MWATFKVEFKSEIFEICHQSSIYEWVLGGTVRIEFEFSHKLQMATQQKTLCILRIDVSRYQLCMNPKSFEALVVS